MQGDTTSGAAKMCRRRNERKGAVHHMALPTIMDDMLQRVTAGFGRRRRCGRACLLIEGGTAVIK